MSRALLIAVLLAASPLAGAGERQLEAGLEGFDYRTAATALNRDNVLGLDSHEDILRGVLRWRETQGKFRGVFHGYVEQRLGSSTETRWRLREGHVQFSAGPALTLRAGKQRIEWGSGIAWNPTNRLEPAKNPLNTSLEREGVWAGRVDWIPKPWAGVIAVGAHGEQSVGDLPFEASGSSRTGAALRVRFLVRDTDLALVGSGGNNLRSLFGLDLGRTVGGVALHAEASLQHGAELPPLRAGQYFARVATGLLYTPGGQDALALEYFYNGEGYSSAECARWLGGLDSLYATAHDPRLPEAARARALDAYLAAALVPYAAGLGLRRHYLHGSWTRSLTGGRFSTALRAVVGLADGAVALTPGLGYAPRGNLTLSLDAVVLLGPEDSEYRLAPLKSSLTARARVLF